MRTWPISFTDDGRVRFHDGKAFHEYCRPFAGQSNWELVVRRKTKRRSRDQNAWLWGVAIPAIAEELGYERHDRAGHEAVHYALIEQCFGTHFDARISRTVPNVRSSKLTTKEFSDYMEWLVRFAAIEYGLDIPLPDDVDWTTVPPVHGEDEGV